MLVIDFYFHFKDLFSTNKNTKTLFIPRHFLWRRYYVIPSEPFECPSVCPSVSASFPDSNLSSFSPKLCMDIDIGEE